MRRTAIVMLIMLGLSSCSVDEHVARVSEKIERQYADSKEWSELPLRVISWEQAVAILMERNLDLKKADSTIRSSERESLSVYTDMVPGVSYYGYFNKSLRDLTSEVNSDDLTSNVNVTFSLPTLTQVPYRVYAAKARTYSAIKAKEGKERELIANLYKLVRQREVSLKKRELESRSSMPGAMAADIRDGQSSVQEDEKYWHDVSVALGDRSARWEILPESMPHVDWKVYEKKTQKLDSLVVCQFALRLEQARMQQYSVALRYLPTINTSLYSPSLFSSSGGTYSGTFLSTDDTRLNLNISYSLDTQLTSWNSYQQSKENYENTYQEILSQISDHKNKLATLRRSVLEYANWRQYMRRRMEYIRRTPVTTADGLIERSKTLFDMERELLNQESQAVESEAAVVLEYGLAGKG